MAGKSGINKWWWIAAAAAVLLFVAFRSCKKDNTIKVSTEKIKRIDIIETVDGTGKINPVNEMKISAEAGSLVTEIYIKEGDTVKKGQLLAIVRTGQTTASSGSSGPRVADLQKLASSGTINPAALAEAMQSRQTAPVISTRQVSQNINAPMDGIISSLQVKKGERMGGTEIARISSAGEWEVRTDVGEVDIVKIKEGDMAEVEPDAFPGVRLSGTVYRIAAGGTMSGSGMGNIYSDLTAYRVFIKVDAASIAQLKDTITGEKLLMRSGMNTTVSIQTRIRKNVMAVPIKSVTTRLIDHGGADTAVRNKRQRSDVVVFAVKDNRIIQKKVTQGIQDMSYIEIISGLSGDENIVTDPFDVIDKTLADGMKVKVVEKTRLFNKN